jgi:hypothetical protein
VQLELPLGLEDEERRPGSKRGMARWMADRAIDMIRDRFGREAIGYGSVTLELAALGLLFISFVAIATTGPQRIRLSKPIDKADRIDDWLYLPEILYVFMLITVVSAGAGPYSLDALILPLIRKHGA